MDFGRQNYLTNDYFRKRLSRIRIDIKVSIRFNAARTVKLKSLYVYTEKIYAFYCNEGCFDRDIVKTYTVLFKFKLCSNIVQTIVQT